MTDLTNSIRRLRAPLTAAGAVVALSGCAATHVGEDWQCPIAQGSLCTSVAAADPVVNDAADAGRMARTARLVPAHGLAESSALPATDPGREHRGDCAVGCNPFAWIARLFDADGKAAVEDMGDASVTESPDVAPEETAAADPAGDDLRAPETIGRIWIAPYVDADGVYREASWVRIVIAPAAWKRP